MGSREITLEDIYAMMNHIKTSKEMTEVMVTELRSKVGDHELAIVTTAKAIEDMNKTFTSLAETFRESRKDLSEFQKETAEFQKQYQIEQVKHWNTQDGIMREIRTVLDNMNKYEAKFAAVESRQLNGCPSFLSFKEKRDVELKHWDDVKNSLTTAAARNREEMDAITKAVAVLVEQKSAVNKRIDDLEKFTDDFNKWKEGVYKALIANGVALLGAIAAIAWKM